MAENAKLQEKLRQGIEAARRGDRIAARRLLQGVISEERNNEIAWMWMASVVDTDAERRSCLEKALQINPNNERAREALRRLGVDVPASPRTATQEMYAATSSGTRRGLNPYYAAAAVVLGLLVVVVLLALFANRPPQVPQTPIAQIAEATFDAALNSPEPSEAPDARVTPTETPFTGIVVTLDPASINLPPTFTPTFTLTSTEEPPATATPYSLTSFSAAYAEFEAGQDQPSLFFGMGDGSQERRVGSGSDGFSDVAFDSTGTRLAFVRTVSYTLAEGGDEVRTPELFVAPANNVGAAQQITQMGGTRLARPAWSPDGSRIAFVSDSDGDDEIYLVTPDGGGLDQITNNQVIDTDPTFSPDGATLVYASEQNSPLFTEIFALNLATREITQLTDDERSSYAPTFSPDGSRIAYASDRAGDGDIYVMDADGQRSFLLTVDDGGAEDRQPVWLPDGQKIAFLSNRDGEAFKWFAVDLRSQVEPMFDSGRLPQSLDFQPLPRPE